MGLNVKHEIDRLDKEIGRLQGRRSTLMELNSKQQQIEAELNKLLGATTTSATAPVPAPSAAPVPAPSAARRTETAPAAVLTAEHKATLLYAMYEQAKEKPLTVGELAERLAKHPRVANNTQPATKTLANALKPALKNGILRRVGGETQWRYAVPEQLDITTKARVFEFCIRGHKCHQAGLENLRNNKGISLSAYILHVMPRLKSGVVAQIAAAISEVSGRNITSNDISSQVCYLHRSGKLKSVKTNRGLLYRTG